MPKNGVQKLWFYPEREAPLPDIDIVYL